MTKMGFSHPFQTPQTFLCDLLSSFLGETSLNFEHRMNDNMVQNRSFQIWTVWGIYIMLNFNGEPEMEVTTKPNTSDGFSKNLSSGSSAIDIRLVDGRSNLTNWSNYTPEI